MNTGADSRGDTLYINPARTADYQAFLVRLRAARKRGGRTQSEVALRLKKPQSYVSKCESGERRIDATEVIAFADLYEVSIEALVRGPLPGGG